MPKTKQPIKIDYPFCYKCGCELTEENARPSDSQTGLSFWCLDCEGAFYESLAQTEGKSLALFHTCAALNVPCKPIVLDGVEFTESENGWLLYLDKLAEKGEDRKGNKLLGFADGETYLLRIFGAGFTERDFAKYIYHERQRIEEAEKKRAEEEARYSGSKEQRAKWGTQIIYKGLEMTQAVYDELDRQYELRAKEFNGQTLTLQQQDTLMEVAKLKVIRAFLLTQGKPKASNDIQKDIDLLLAGEQMRKKDQKPVQAYRIDSQAVALENAGLMENGKLLPIDKLQKVLFERFIKGKGKYDYTLDVVDSIIEKMYNTMRANAELFISTELPDTLEVDDRWGEMADKKTEQQKENERYTGATKVTFVKEDKKEGTN